MIQISKSEKRRVLSEKTDLTATLLNAIGVGKNQKIKLSTLIKEHLSHYQRPRQSSEAFKKDIYRIITSYLSDDKSGLQVLGEGKSPRQYYWSSIESKTDAIEAFSMSEARAFAFQFIEEYLSTLIPPHIYKSLTTDFIKANEVISKTKSNKYLNKLDFNPMGYDSFSKLNQESFTANELEKWQSIFAFTFDESCFTASYTSIHSKFDNGDGKLLLSPQRIVLLNNQITVLAYEHNAGALKFFEIRRLTNIKKSKITFQSVEDGDYQEKHYFKAICHTWVKHYFESIHLGDSTRFSPTSHQNCWVLESQITFPKHFNFEGTDPFFFANFLGMFSDSIVVEEPAFLKEELARRAKQLVEMYQNKDSHLEVIANSPETMANKNNKA